ncbi:MAG: hypothetical protein LBQ54_06675 [Planctomycetaceae bacterium]|jgi:ABC-type multidrug transport system fused ATPase/permease subunit|nr:hypothetical protein [Planctomycetaceae bacterium]
MLRHIFGHALLALVVVVGFGAAVMFLWNYVIIGIFGLAAINYWQAAGLFILARILFGKGIHGRGHDNFLKHLLHDKWHNMSHDERKNFIQNVLKHRHGKHPINNFFELHDEPNNEQQHDETDKEKS